MSTEELGILQSGLNALKQKLYPDAINKLENFCQICEVRGKTNCKEYLQGQMGLTQAYHFTGKITAARTIAEKLIKTQNPQIQIWAQRVLDSLPAESLAPTTEADNKPPLEPQEAAELLKKGSQALKFQRYGEAVQALEEFCKRAGKQAKDYSQAQIWLVKAYKGNEQLEDAIALCEQLTTNEQEATQIWAKRFLSTLVPVSEPPVSSESESTAQPNSTNHQTAKVEMKMRTLEEFKTFCQQNLLDDLKDLEATRKQVLISILVVNSILIIILIALIRFLLIGFIFEFIKDFGDIPLVPVFVLMFGILGCLWGLVAFYTSSTETYASGFKSKIIQKIFDFINTNETLNYKSLSSEADDRYTMSGFTHSQLFQTLLKPNRIIQNDCIFGILNEVPIFFSEISAQVEVEHRWFKYLGFSQQMRMLGISKTSRFFSRSVFSWMLPIYILMMTIQFCKGIPYVISRMIIGKKIDYQRFQEEILNNEVSRQEVFKGLFFQANFNKTLKFKTIVLPNLTNININALPQGSRQLVKLEDPKFNQYFVVYANDQVEARYVLSTNLMEKLVKFRQKARRNIYISFIDNMIYIGIGYTEDIFEPWLFKSMLSFAPMREYFENIQLMLGIIKDLNLNNRIWH